MDAYKPSTPEVDGGRQISVRDQTNLVYRVPSHCLKKEFKDSLSTRELMASLD